MYEVDFLLIDEFGWGLDDRTESQFEAAEFLIKVIEKRSETGKYTIITLLDGDIYGNTIKKYINYLKRNYKVIYTGNTDLRLALLEGKRKEHVITIPGKFLGKSWIIEKIERIEKL